MSDEFFFFWRHHLGQWTVRDMVIDGVTYCCAEQWMMAEKARMFHDDKTLTMILSEKDPRTQQALGRIVKGFNQQKWDERAREIVFVGNMAKFTQHSDFKRMLLSTGNKILVEASPYDRVWGIGLGAIDPRAQDRSQWRGKNWLGEVLMRVREEIRKQEAGTCP